MRTQGTFFSPYITHHWMLPLSKALHWGVLLIFISSVALSAFLSCALPMPVTAGLALESPPKPASEALKPFASALDGNPKHLIGVFVAGVLALPVVPQPNGNLAYVSSQEGVATEFALARKYGSIGLLAHNYLAGKAFFQLKPGDLIALVYGDGRLETYRVLRLERYQALSPNSPYSTFVDLNNPQTRLSSTELFMRIYGSGKRLVLQTCIEQNGQPSWGRLFILAEPLSNSEALSAMGSAGG